MVSFFQIYCICPFFIRQASVSGLVLTLYLHHLPRSYKNRIFDHNAEQYEKAMNHPEQHFQDEQTLKTDLSPCESADATYDAPLDLSVKDEPRTGTTVPAEQISPTPEGGQDLNQDECWSAASLIGQFVQSFYPFFFCFAKNNGIIIGN